MAPPMTRTSSPSASSYRRGTDPQARQTRDRPRRGDLPTQGPARRLSAVALAGGGRYWSGKSRPARRLPPWRAFRVAARTIQGAAGIPPSPPSRARGHRSPMPTSRKAKLPPQPGAPARLKVLDFLLERGEDKEVLKTIRRQAQQIKAIQGLRPKARRH